MLAVSAAVHACNDTVTDSESNHAYKLLMLLGLVLQLPKFDTIAS